MKIDTVLELYQMISSGTQELPSRKSAMELRKSALNSYNSITKLAFDTRRINQETEYNPRRGLQHYHRSEQFVSPDMKEKIKIFSKLSNILDKIKSEYGREAEWQDSYVRVLSSAVHKGLRTVQADGDYSDAQPSMASIAYLEELLYVRYRLTADALNTMSEKDLRNAILSKDELLVNGGISSAPIIPSDVTKYSYDGMMEKMFASMLQVMSQMQNQNNLISNSKIQSQNELTNNATISQMRSQMDYQNELTNKIYNLATKEIKDPENNKNITINIKV